MKDDGLHLATQMLGQPSEAAIQVICLGSGGGPSEDNVTGFLVRSTAAKWAKNSVLAVDAGTHLASITRILSRDFPLVSEPKVNLCPNGMYDKGTDRSLNSPSPRAAPTSPSDDESGVETSSSDAGAEAEYPPTILESGAFVGLPFPHASARANALHVVREHISTYLITHPHLDHVSGFVINTAAFHNTSRPKRLAALPFTVNAIKAHIFNNIVWPNLTDEDGGVGLVTFQRLQEGGNIALGEGSGRGYIEVCDGLGVRGFKVSHGHCMRGPGHVHRGSNTNLPETPGMGTHRTLAHHADHIIPDGHEGRSLSITLPTQSTPGTPIFSSTTGDSGRTGGSVHADHCVIDSTAYFIRTESTPTTPTKEILIFGDVEPDSLSLSPRTAHVWAEAAPKIAEGTLAGIFIECSYTNTQGDPVLYGHLAPRHVLAELQTLAELVKEARKEQEKEREEARKGRKRKRASNGLASGAGWDSTITHVQARKSSRGHAHAYRAGGGNLPDDQTGPNHATTAVSVNNRLCSSGAGTSAWQPQPSAPAAQIVDAVSAEQSKRLLADASEAPLSGLKVVVMHVKDTLCDGPLVGDCIIRELNKGERELAERGRGLGCDFEVAVSGHSYWF